MVKEKSSKVTREERDKMVALKYKFENRITIAKHGKELLDAGEYALALTKFTEYMQTMADVKCTKDFYSIKPSHFDSKKELTEMLMISHIYFEMARIYDAVPKFQEDSKKCLDQFVEFSVNQPYQVVNSEIIRKYLKKSQFKKPEVFSNAYQQIYIQSKKCYVVTFCYGHGHVITQDYRKLKDVMLNSSSGREFVRLYYKYSSNAVERWENDVFMIVVANILIKPLLLLFSKTVLRFILK